MPKRALQVHEIDKDEICNISVDFQGYLDTGELLSGTPTVSEVNTSHFTISSAQVSSAALTINGQSVAISKAVQFKLDPGASAVQGNYYAFDISCATDATPAQTRVGQVIVKVLD